MSSWQENENPLAIYARVAADAEEMDEETAARIERTVAQLPPPDMGVSPDQFRGDHAYLVKMLADNSGSMFEELETGKGYAPRFGLGEPTTRMEAFVLGRQSLVEALREDEHPEGYLFSLEFLNPGPERYNPTSRLHEPSYSMQYTPYELLADVKDLPEGFAGLATGGTPFYERSYAVLAQVAANATRFRDEYKDVHTATVLVTDGLPTDGIFGEYTAETVGQLIAGMLKTKIHLVMGMGIGDDKVFRPLFTSIGIPDNLVLTAGSSAKEIRDAFGQITRLTREAHDPTKFQYLLTAGFDGLK